MPSATRVTLLDRSDPEELVRGVAWSRPPRVAMDWEVEEEGCVEEDVGFLSREKSPNESRRLPSSPNDPRSLVSSERRLLPPPVADWRGGGRERERERDAGGNGILGKTS